MPTGVVPEGAHLLRAIPSRVLADSWRNTKIHSASSTSSHANIIVDPGFLHLVKEAVCAQALVYIGITVADEFSPAAPS